MRRSHGRLLSFGLISLTLATLAVQAIVGAQRSVVLPTTPPANIALRLDTQLAAARERRLSRFLAMSPAPGQIVTSEQLLKAHPLSEVTIADSHLVRRSDGATLLTFHDRQLVRTPDATMQKNVVTYVNLVNGTYRSFVLQGTTPSASDLQRVRDQIESDGFKVSALQLRSDQRLAFQSRSLNPTPAASSVRFHNPRRPLTVASNAHKPPSVVNALFRSTASLFYPKLSAQEPGCWGYWSSTNGVIDPVGIQVAAIYPSLQWDTIYGDWEGYGNIGYYTYHGVTDWYVDYGDFIDDNYDGIGPDWGTAWMDTGFEFYNTNFPLNPPPTPVYAWLSEYIGYDYGWIDPEPAFSLYGQWTYALLSNYPTGYFGDGLDGCYYGF